ncbi:uncharacterized protein [Setaria viridis]|uniref:Major facilitator superfamily (MFS) profile domain-containing protein n=1 Tax=Setaria viridis TaxID=4556 RepID=A0A4U6WD95_SETVI|nr:sugar transport protein MST1-like isoform X2 [Setaria viridis]TKW39874.1 hypothetical protein SEVIR_1G208600v2 [Setaria viridis]
MLQQNSGVLKMQSSMMAFFPNIAAAKLELHSLYRKYVDMFGTSSNNSTVGSHITRKMTHLPVQLIDRTFFSTGTAIRSIAVSYGALVLRWLLSKTSVVQRTLLSRAIRSLYCWCDSLPFLVGVDVLMARLCDCTMIHNHLYGQKFILGHNPNFQGESAMGMENNELCNEQPFLSSLFGNKRDYVRLALQCICYPSSLKVVDVTKKKLSFNRQRIQSGYDASTFWRIMARNEHYLACMMVLVALQLFLQLTRVNVTTLFLPMLSRATSSRSSRAVIGNIVLVLVNSCGVLGSALATKHYGREVTFTMGAVLMVFCQVAIPLILEVQIGVGGGIRMPMGCTTAMFALTCVVSCGLSWSWGSFFWTIPGRKFHSAGQVLTMILNFGVCFAQMQYFLLMLCRQKNAILVYYAMWIWS